MTSDKQSAQCPRCKSSDIYRIKKNKLENLRNHIQPIKVFECLYCNYRFTVPAEKESGKKPGKLHLIAVALLLGLVFVAVYLALQPQNKSAGYQQTLKVEEPSAGTKTDDGRSSDVQKEALALLNSQWTREEAVENAPPDGAQIRITPPPAALELAVLDRNTDKAELQQQQDARMAELEQQEKAIMSRIETLQAQAAEQKTREIEQMQGIQREHDSRLVTLNKKLESAQQQIQQRNDRINELAQQEQAIQAKIVALQLQAAVQETQSIPGTTQSRKQQSAWAGVPAAIHGEDYTIQIASVSSEAEVGRLIASLDRKAGVTEPFYYYLSRKQSNDWYPVLYGVFSSRKAALNALAKLPQALKSHDPMVRQIKYNSAPMIRY